MPRPCIAGAVLLLCAGCDLLPNQGNGLALRIDRVTQRGPAGASTLVLDGALVNTGSQDFTAESCTRPEIAIDSLGAGQWVTLETVQADALINCVRGFTVAGGSTGTFTTEISRARSGAAFATNVLLRARLRIGQSQTGPTAGFTLQR